MSGGVYLELSEDEKNLRATYAYNPILVKKLEKLGGRFVGPAKPEGPCFKFVKDLEVAKSIREVFGDKLTLGPKLKTWSRDIILRRSRLAAINTSDSVELVNLPKLNPDLFAFISGRKYQPPDVAFLAACPNPMNANQPGLGKTVECISAVYEALLHDGPKLVTCPVSSLDVVWDFELSRWTDDWILVAPDGRQPRIRMMQQAYALADAGEPFWLVLPNSMLQMKSGFNTDDCEEHDESTPTHIKRSCPNCEEYRYHQYPELDHIDWNVFIIDEYQKVGLGDPSTATAQGANSITAKKKIAISGTPIGGKPIKLFGILHFLEPKEFSSKWRFAEQWLEVFEEDTRVRGGGTRHTRTIGGLNEAKKDKFYEMLSSYMVRRLKSEVATDLPPIQVVDLWVPKTAAQAEQYDAFAAETEVRIDDYNISAVGILAEYARLKQFSNAVQRVDVVPNEDPDVPPALILNPTEDSPKLPIIMELLAERGITGDEDATTDAQVVIFSESERMVSMVNAYLRKHGIPSERFVGQTSRARRSELQQEFQREGGLQVLCLTTTAGGVSITLDRADTAIFLDETWNPDDQEQAADRIHRVSRIHQVTAYYIRTRGTIQEYIEERVEDKSQINREILNFRQMGYFSPKQS